MKVKDSMLIKLSARDIERSVRHGWAFRPTTRIVNSKKIYSRKDKSWKKDI